MILLLVRHGLTSVTGQKLTGRLPGFGLSDQGQRQAQAAANRLASVPLQAIYSSPMQRCTQTAEAIAAMHGKPVVTVDKLSEIDYGRWQGKSFKTLYKNPGWKKLRARPADFRFPGGETIREAQTRGVLGVEELRTRHPEESAGAVVACSHSDMIRLLVAAYLGLGIDLYDRINVAPGSITAVSVGEGTPALLSLNDTGDYDGLQNMLKATPEKSKEGR
ncbi:MAG: MSMEG_4193 family putative phosphomutase [Actinomycetota bacterium]